MYNLGNTYYFPQYMAAYSASGGQPSPFATFAYPNENGSYGECALPATTEAMDNVRRIRSWEGAISFQQFHDRCKQVRVPEADLDDGELWERIKENICYSFTSSPMGENNFLLTYATEADGPIIELGTVHLVSQRDQVLAEDQLES